MSSRCSFWLRKARPCASRRRRASGGLPPGLDRAATQASLAAFVLLGSSLCVTPGARAFSEPLLYPEPTLAGGGGGRFFTGSPLDGFSCVVCHEGAADPEVTVRGFPEFFEAGKKYEVELSWTQPERPHALNLEIVDTDGKTAGTITLPDDADVDDEGRCTLSDDEATRDQVAATLVEAGERRVVSVLGCGSQSLKFTFEAPDVRRIALTAGIVRSNKEEDTKGDGVLELRRFSRQEGAVGRPISSGCAASPKSAASVTAELLLVLLGLLWRRRVDREPGEPLSRSRNG